MGENIDPTWLAFTGERDLDAGSVRAGLERVSRNYGRLVDYPLRTDVAIGGRNGVAVIGDAEPRCRWPHFAEGPDLLVACAYVPYGWHRLASAGPLEQASLELGRRVRDDPRDVALRLASPIAIAVLEPGQGRLTVLNDALGAARVFGFRTPELAVWSNRPGALHLFAGQRPAADESGWRVLAAAGWLLGRASPIAGVRRLAPGTVVTADGSGISERSTDAVRGLVRPDGRLRELAPIAAVEMADQVAHLERLWPERADVDLSGGRDSRVVAAATIAAGLDARFVTSDATPGEAEVAEALIAAAPGEHAHRVRRRKERSASPGTPLLERAANLHLLHDGVRHPQKLRGKMTLPRPRPEGAKLSGHGGEIAQGFFYKTDAEVRRLRLGRGRLLARVMRFFEKGHRAATAECYAQAEAVVAAILDEGRAHGLRGPALLDWFYLTDRFAHRSGMATDSERVALFATPAVITAAFSMRPRDRVRSRLHDALVEEFVPQWRAQPYFKAPAGRLPKIKRERLWESEDDARVVEEILAAGGSWTELYERETAVRAWERARVGEGQAKWESLFEGIIYRATFDEHLDALGRAATV